MVEGLGFRADALEALSLASCVLPNDLPSFFLFTASESFFFITLQPRAELYKGL